jgi:predicted CoA-binding protein
MTDAEIETILRTSRTFAVVGASNDASRPSYGVMTYLHAMCYRIMPLFPTLAGETLLGERVAADLASLEEPIDVVDIFRRSDAALEAVRLAIREKDRLAIKTVWMQIGVINEQAAAEARDAGLTVVMDRCPAIEYPRLIGRG